LKISINCDCEKGRAVRRGTHLVLAKVIGQIGDHDLGLGRNAVLRGASLLARSTGLTQLVGAGIAGGLHLLAKLAIGKRTYSGFTGCSGSGSWSISTSFVAVHAIGTCLHDY
jgi:hypothetical protein